MLNRILIESYPPQISPIGIFDNIIFWGETFLIYTFREYPVVKPIWKAYKLLLFILLAILVINFIKEQWNKKTKAL
jgi:hypothetical protein